MNILYITKGDHVDYLNDCLLIGLKELFGVKVVDFNKQLHNYKSYDPEAALKLYGKGFSVTRVLDDLDVDRSNLTEKIKQRFFDLIVYGSIWRCSDHLDEILKYYSPSEIAVVDGEDETHIHPCIAKGILYFKRELLDPAISKNIFPISFAIPTSKVNFVTTGKTCITAPLIPGDVSTYIYRNEDDYYKMYQKSQFGLTFKKAGWDCMRHYEVIGNGCLPRFRDIENCPPYIMVNFPKKECFEILQKWGPNRAFNDHLYNEYSEVFKERLFKDLTTFALGNYFIGKIQ